MNKIMKMKKFIIPCVLIIAGFSVVGQEVPAEEETVEPVMEMIYLKDSEGNINLRSNMVNYVNRMPVPLSVLVPLQRMGMAGPFCKLMMDWICP